MKGIVNAANSADALYGLWLNEFPEYYVTCAVADELARTIGDKGWVHLERTRASVLKSGRAERRGKRLKTLPAKARFDLTVYYSNENPRAVIEIKSPVYSWGNTTIRRDVDRICDVVKRSGPDGTIDFGILGWYTDAGVPVSVDGTATERIRRYFERWESQTAEIAAENGLATKFLRSPIKRSKAGVGEAYEAWAAWVAVIERSATP